VISPTHTPLPESTQHSQETDRTATGIGLIIIIIIIIIIIRESSSEREVEENGKAHDAVSTRSFERLTQ